MNRHNKIGIGALVVICATLTYSLVNFAMLDTLELKQAGNDNFDYSHLATGIRFNLCNPSFLPVTYSGVIFNIQHRGEEFASLSDRGGTVYPHKEKLIEPEFDLGKEQISTMFSSSLLNSNLESAGQKFLDPSMLNVTAVYQAKILGFIPLSSSSQYTGEEFVEELNNSTNYGCQNK